MDVDAPGWDCVRGNMESFGLSGEDAQEIDQLKLRIKKLADCGLLGK